jgi:hypothetical protein
MANKFKKPAAAPIDSVADQAREELLTMSLETRGTTGLKQTGGYVYEEFLPKLRGLNGAKFFREMEDNSSVLGTVRFVFRALVTQLEWKFTACERGGSKGAEYAEFFETCRNDMEHSWNAMLHDVCSMNCFGWAYMEQTYKVRRGLDMPPLARSKHDDGRFGWRKIQLRAQDTLNRWEFDVDSGELLGMHQLDPYTGKVAFIPLAKALLFRTEPTKDNPEGRSLYRNAVVDYHYMKRMQEVEAIGAERDLNGVPDMQVPKELLSPNASAEHRAMREQFEQMLGEVKVDERAYVLRPSETLPGKDGGPSGYKFQLLASTGARQVNTNEIIQRYEARMLRSVLLQFLVLGQQGGGGLNGTGASVVQDGLFKAAFKSFADGIAEVINRVAVPRLIELNGMDPEYAPQLGYTGLDNPALSELGDYVSKLVTATVITPTIEMERELLKRAGLPHGHLVTPQDEAKALENAATADEMLEAIGYKPEGVPDPTKPVLDSEPVELNGIQVESIVTVLTAAASGALPRESEMAVIQAMGISRDKAEAMLSTIGEGFTPSGAPVMGPDGKPIGGGQPLNPAPNGTAPAPGQSQDELIQNGGMNPEDTPAFGEKPESKDETKVPPK